MDSQYQNLPMHIARAEATATDTTVGTSTMQRSSYSYPHSPRDDVSSISEEHNDDESRIARLQNPVHPISEKDPRMMVGPVNSFDSSTADDHDKRESREHQDFLMRMKNLAHHWWLFELGALAISYAAMLALVVVLKVYATKPIPRWPGHITLNAFISIASTIMKAAIAVPLTASISQMKWIFFKERNPLRGMQVFDEASRGPLGALKLLCSRYVLNVASLGALIILLSLGMDPFFQQVVSYPLESHLLEASTAQLPKGGSYDRVRATDRTGSPAAEYAMQQAVYGSIFLGSLKTTNAFCSSGNCTWPNFRTLGVCNRCEEISSLIEKREVPYPYWNSEDDSDISKTMASYHVPNGLNVTLPKIRPGSYFYDEPAVINANGNMILTELPMIDFTILNMSIMSTQAAYECNVHWCVKEYNSTMSEGVLTEVPVTMDPQFPRFDAYNEDTEEWCDWLPSDIEWLYVTGVPPPVGTPIYTQDANLSGDPDHNCISKFYTDRETFYFTNASHYALQNLLQGLFTANLTWGGDTYLNPSSDTMQSLTTDWNFPKIDPGKPMDPNANRYAAGNITLVNIPELMNNLTESMTVRMRQAAAELPPNNSTVNGKTFQLQAFVKVRWRWLTLPILVLFLTAVLLVTSIFLTFSTKSKPWKSSATAMLFHGLDPERLDQVSSIKKRAQMDEASREIAVQLVKTDHGWRLL